MHGSEVKRSFFGLIVRLRPKGARLEGRGGLFTRFALSDPVTEEGSQQRMCHMVYLVYIPAFSQNLDLQHLIARFEKVIGVQMYYSIKI